jgi:hypothetical protein
MQKHWPSHSSSVLRKSLRFRAAGAMAIAEREVKPWAAKINLSLAYVLDR